MENISFVLWVVLYPLASSISLYVGTKRKKINNEEPYSEGLISLVSFIEFLVWAIIGINLYV